MATTTKVSAQLSDWTALAAAGNAFTVADVTTTFDSPVLMVTVCPVEAVALANGVLVILEGLFDTSEAGDNTSYRQIGSPVRLAAGTAATADVATQAEPSDPTLVLSTGTGFDTPGDKFLIHNTVDVLDSETHTVASESAATVTMIDAIVTQQQTSANAYNIVAEHAFYLPPSVRNARVILINDDADCDVIFRVDINKITAVS